MNSAERLAWLVGVRTKHGLTDFGENIKHFHARNPSTFHNGAFIFADGSIWWAR